MAIDFVDNLPDTCEVLAQNYDENEHIVYYMVKGGKEFYRKKIETEQTDTLMSDVAEGLEIKEVLAGKENIMVCADHADMDFQSAELYLYSLKEQKFEKLGEFDFYENNPEEKTVYCSTTVDMPRLYTKILTAKTFDYDGKLIKEEEWELGDSDFMDGESEVERANRLGYEQQHPEQVFYCRFCRSRVMARDVDEANDKAGLCVTHDVYNSLYNTTIQTVKHDWEYVIY